MRALFRTAVALAALLFTSAADAGTVTYYYNDLAGSPVVATDASGTVIWRESYQPYGARTRNEVAAGENKVWFTSRRQDAETGLVYMGARYYDPVVGRFVSTDPVGFDEGNIHSFNRYAYANNTPYRYKDPDGWAADLVVDAGFVVYDTGRFLGAGAAWLIGRVMGNSNLVEAGISGMKETGVDLAVSVGSAIVPGVSAPLVRGSLKISDGAVEAGNAVAQSKRFSKDKEALVEMARQDKHRGISEADMQAYKELNKQLPDPFPTSKVRGPEVHSGGSAHSQQPHGHVGPVDHIPITR